LPICVKNIFLKKDWAKLKDKQETVNVMYKNRLTVFDAYKKIIQRIKK
jgi:hypothetical protein